ncbi:BTAD domain-containing putative transcriptional regulator [Kitasatospora sp. NPDC058115]|uniref:AfsR/SARP family transcriptional regulator n=1 Tax=Kitasatospora sp. NPDC058115 TaxID=3346347 RepID=UPI0036DD0D6C
MTAHGGDMEFRLLGPVEAGRCTGPIEILGTKENTLLAALLLARGKVVSDERLTELLWGWDPPKTVSAQIYTYISRLRKRLGPEVELVRRQPGYLLDVRGSRVDVTEFERLARLGAVALQDGRHADAAELLRDALGLWSGTALANVTPHLTQAYGPQLEETRAATLEQRIEADLALGAHHGLIAELTGLVAEFPVRERLRAQLMTALYRCGRQSDALAVFHEGRQVLSEELGIDPSAVLTDTYQAVLTGSLDAGVPLPDPEASPVPEPLPFPGAPVTLPPDLPDFVGRRREFERLCALLRPAPGAGGPGGPRRFLVAGMGGVGKTALALHAVHHLRESFPDGRLHVTLCRADGEPKDPREVLTGLLRALGERPGPPGEDLDDLVRRYRAATYDKRMLILLDNAVGDRQLEPLLPSTPGPTLLITGRTVLAGVPREHTLPLGPLDDDDARLLLSAVLGAGRAAESPADLDDLVTHCAGLPLALRIAGARYAARPRGSATRLARRLADRTARLDELRLGDLDVRQSLLLSVRRLAPDSQAFLRRLARVRRGSFSAAEAATALAVPAGAAERMMEGLVDASLMDVAGADREERLRYRFHELVHLLAAEPAPEPAPVVRLPVQVRSFVQAPRTTRLTPKGAVRPPLALGRTGSTR